VTEQEARPCVYCWGPRCLTDVAVPMQAPEGGSAVTPLEGYSSFPAPTLLNHMAHETNQRTDTTDTFTPQLHLE